MQHPKERWAEIWIEYPDDSSTDLSRRVRLRKLLDGLLTKKDVGSCSASAHYLQKEGITIACEINTKGRRDRVQEALTVLYNVLKEQDALNDALITLRAEGNVSINSKKIYPENQSGYTF